MYLTSPALVQHQGGLLMAIRQKLSFSGNLNVVIQKLTVRPEFLLWSLENETQVPRNRPYQFLNMCCDYFEIVLSASVTILVPVLFR